MSRILSQAEIQQRRDAARSRWQKEAIGAGVGVLTGLALHTGSNKIARSISGKIQSKIDTKVLSVLNRQQGNVNAWETNKKAAIKVLTDKTRKTANAGPQKLIQHRLKQLDLWESRIRRAGHKLHAEDEAEHGIPNETAVYRDPETLRQIEVTRDDVVNSLQDIRKERQYLVNVVNPYRHARRGHLRRTPSSTPENPVFKPVVNSRPHVKGTLDPTYRSELKSILLGQVDDSEKFLNRKITIVARNRSTRNLDQMNNVHEKLRAYYAKRGWKPKHAAALGIGGSVLAGAGTTAALNVQKMEKSVSDDLSANIAAVMQKLKEQTKQMIDNVSSNKVAFDLGVFETKLREALEPLKQYFQRGVADGTKTERPKTINVRWDVLQPRIFDHLQGHITSLVRELTDEQHDLVHEVITRGLASGLPTTTMARQLKQFIGLTQKQAEYVGNYRNELVSLQSSALARGLRDRRFDPTVIKAVAKGQPLTGDQINKIVDSYSRRFLAMRSHTIARTEALRATNLGHISSIKEVALKHGLQVEKTWLATEDTHTREAHKELDGKSVIGVDNPFNSELGPIRYPYDPNATAGNVINCRCAMKFRLLPSAQTLETTS